MGVNGLHPQLKQIQTPCTLSKYKGLTLAIDTYSWLHKATISCAQELCQNQPTQKYISSVTKKVNMLRHFGVEPYLVFDGASLPTKAATAAERRVKREQAQKKADELISKGNRKLAWKEFMKAAGVTFEMAKSIMNEMDKLNVKYVVAPYEADPQMVYLEKIGLVDGIISEDSDLLIFGCKRLITKLNDFGECIEINRDDFGQIKAIAGLDQEQLRLVAMLSGCDYTKGIPGVGLVTAFNMVRKYNNSERVIMALRADSKKIPDSFNDELLKADLAFQYQKVFNPKTQTLETLYAYPEDFSIDMAIVEDCCGYSFDNEIHIKIAKGLIHPNTHELLVSREQDITMLKSKSITSRTADAPKPKNSIDNFFSKRTIEKVRIETITAATETETETSKGVLLQTKSVETSVKVSPVAKRIKQFIDIQQTPKISKFFNTPSKDSIFPDITGDSEITETSPSTTKIVDTTNVLSGLNADSNDELNADDNEEFNDEESQNTQVDVITKEESNVTDFDLDEEDDEIEESPVKIMSRKQFVEDKTQIRKILRDTFSYSAEEFESPKFNTMNSFDSDSSLDLKSDDLKKGLEKENIEPPVVRSLSRFAFDG